MYGLTALPRDYFWQISYSLISPTLHSFTALNDLAFGEIKELKSTKMRFFSMQKQQQNEYDFF
jgi:hypothetical protein